MRNNNKKLIAVAEDELNTLEQELKGKKDSLDSMTDKIMQHDIGATKMAQLEKSIRKQRSEIRAWENKIAAKKLRLEQLKK